MVLGSIPRTGFAAHTEDVVEKIEADVVKSTKPGCCVEGEDGSMKHLWFRLSDLDFPLKELLLTFGEDDFTVGFECEMWSHGIYTPPLSVWPGH